MSVLAAGTSSLVPAIIAAIASAFSAVVLGLVALRAQSAREQKREIVEAIEEKLREFANSRRAESEAIVRRAVREVLGNNSPRKRRWYDD